MKIEKRKFEASDKEVALEILKLCKLHDDAGIESTVSKVKSELKCTEGDLLSFIERTNFFHISTASNRRGTTKQSVRPSAEFSVTTSKYADMDMNWLEQKIANAPRVQQQIKALKNRPTN